MIIDNSKPVKRLGVYFFYDPDGIVDNYIPVLLRDLIRNLEMLVFVSNGPIAPAGKKKLEEFHPIILERDNRGMDVWAYKEAMEYFGWQKLAEFDEVVLLNFTLMGPLYPFKEAFDEMASRDVHFWGLTRHHGMPFDPWNTCKYGYIPMHIQSSFMVFRQNFIKSKAFQHYWDTIPMIRSYDESIGWHEAIFTKDFTQLGFKSDVYINTDDLQEFNAYPLMLYAKELVKNRRCPVFKRKMFYNMYMEFMGVSNGQSGRDLYEFLENESTYDIDLVWDVMLRTAHMSDIKERLQLNFILPDTVRLPDIKPTLKAALFLHIYYLDQIDWCLSYAKNTPEDFDIFISTDTSQKQHDIEQKFCVLAGRKVKVVLIENRGRDVSALLIGFKPYLTEYDVICFAHDKKTQYFKPYIIGESFAYHCFENVLASRAYIQNILKTFKDNPRLGMLTPPTPIYDGHASLPGNEWSVNFEATKKLASTLNIHVPMSKDVPPIAPIGTMFWFRPQALMVLLNYNFEYDDFPVEPDHEPDGTIMHAIERLYPFAVQEEGFFTAWVMPLSFAQLEITNYHKIAKDYNSAFNKKVGVGSREYYLSLIEEGNVTDPAQLSKNAIKTKAKKLILKVSGQQGLSATARLWRKIKG